MSILDEIKELLEITDDDGLYNKQVILIANTAIAYLINNNIPISKIDTNGNITNWLLQQDDYNLVLTYIHLHTTQIFDKNITQKATIDYIESEKINILTQLKTKYDR